MNKDYAMSQEDLDDVLSMLNKINLQSAFGKDTEVQYIRGLLKQYHVEYMASIQIGLTTKNHNERTKAFNNALNVMQENKIKVLEHQMNRKPFDVIYSLDYHIRIHHRILDKDFRREVIKVISGQKLNLPTVSKAKDEEVTLQELEQQNTKTQLEDRDRYKEDHYLNNIESI
ncbi:MAG TPA: hypothetical protein EYO75_03600 [Sulfurimonas sp.]|nr:hypothetical protein [Sulfurimonas sp.]HIM74782.1 hypothetical protein [Campylobacterales bacterium]